MTNTKVVPTAAERRPLYERFTHYWVRMVLSAMLVACSIAIAEVVFRVATKGAAKEQLLFATMALPLGVIARIFLSPRAIYGSPCGLEYKYKGTWRTVPWINVGVPEFAPWYWGYLVRFTSVEIEEPEGSKTLWFFATSGYLEEFKRMRHVGTASATRA